MKKEEDVEEENQTRNRRRITRLSIKEQDED